MRWILTCAAHAAVLGSSATALATPPDFDGERGVEAHATFGAGSLFNDSQRVFQSPSEATAVGPADNALGAGFNFRLGAGYRFTPYLSVGLALEVQTLGAAPVPPLGTPPGWRLIAGAWAFGAYARFYPMSLATGATRVPRVNFTSSDQSLRRLEPWVSLGVEVHTLWRTLEQDPGPHYTRWTQRAVGLPISIGFDFRVIPALAVGVAMGATPLFSAGVEKSERFERGGNDVDATANYAPAASVNAAWFVGLGARYTFTF